MPSGYILVRGGLHRPGRHGTGSGTRKRRLSSAVVG